MIRATVISVVDQGLLSAINFLAALALIRFATPEEYGLYTQLIGLQALFSVLHAGLFVSAFLALLPRLSGSERREYQAGMARAEFGITLSSALLVALLTWWVARWLSSPIGFAASAASALALLGLWWREFARARYFAELVTWRVLRLDSAYAVLVLAGLTWLVLGESVSAAAVLWCLGIAGALVAALPLLRQAGVSEVDSLSVGGKLAASWQAARWEVLTSLVTWTHAQTFVYFAAMQGGLRASALISAARLLTMPLSLVWSSYANVLRPNASKLLDGPDAARELARLARRSALWVLAFAAAYSLLLMLAMPLLDALLFGEKFAGLASLTSLWLVYFSLTGMTTIAASLLRSAIEFRAVFAIHAICALLAVAGSCAGLAFATPAAFIVVLIVVEVVLAALLWRQLLGRLRGFVPGALAAPAVREV